MSLATGLLRLSVSKGEQYIALSSDTRFQTPEPHIPNAFRHWSLLWMSGICSWLFAAKAESNQLRGISGLVSRLYLGFYIPCADLPIRMTKKYVTHLTRRKAGPVCQ